MAQESIQEHIAWLEQQLEAKKKELQESGENKGEREVVREVIRDVAGEKISPPPPITSALSDDDAAKQALDLKEKEHEHIIQELVTMAISKDLFSALKLANALRNPHILDEFHDALADHYYDKLLQSRKLRT